MAIPLSIALAILAALAIVNLTSPHSGIYTRLAESFLHGQLSYLNMPASGILDLALFDGRLFCPFGVGPSIVAIPFIILTGEFPQGALNFILVLATFYVTYRIALKSGYSSNDSVWLAIAFCFGTAFLEVAVFNWHIAHTAGTLFIVLALCEFVGKKRPWLIGLLIGGAMANRPAMAINALFFLGAFWFESRPVKERLARGVTLCACFALIAAPIALYNFARFGNPLEFGYTYQMYSETLAHADWNVRGNIAGPLFALWHIPINLETFLLGLPDREHVGTSVLLMSPWLVYLIGGRRWERTDWLILANTIIIATVMLAFRSTGFRQAGYRFSLEFMPLLFWLLLRRRTEITATFKSLILLAVAIDISLVVYFIAVRIVG
jgi:hypothetical protein